MDIREEKAMRRELAHSRIEEAMRLVEEAQGILDRAARNLCPIVGAIPKHRKAGKLSDRCHVFWYELKKYRDRGRYAIDGAREGLLFREKVER